MELNLHAGEEAFGNRAQALDAEREKFVRAHGTLWAAAFRDPSSNLHTKGTLEAIAAFETGAGVTLPPSHREFLLRSNGGQAGYILYLGADYEGDDLAWHAVHLRPDLEKTAGKPVLPFAHNWGGDYYCYDLSRPLANGDFRVLCWDHAATDRGEDGSKIWSEVALDFLDFLAQGLKKSITVPAFVLTEDGAEYWFDGTRRSVLEWSRAQRIAVQVVIDDDWGYFEGFWQLTGPGVDFRAPLGLALGAERFEARLLGFTGFDLTAYQQARAAAARPDDGVFVCWSKR